MSIKIDHPYMKKYLFPKPALTYSNNPSRFGKDKLALKGL